MMNTKNESEVQRLVQMYDMQQHPEGGWYKETFKSSFHFQRNKLADSTDSTAATVCYYLLPKNDFAGWRLLASDEMWMYHDGGCLKIHMIDENGIYSSAMLGRSLDYRDAQYEVLVPAGMWSAAQLLRGSEFSLIGCVVAPGFDWNGFELGREEYLVTTFPHLAHIIKPYCKQ